MQEPRQYVLDLGHRTALGREDFLVAPSNQEAVGWLDRWPAWPSSGLVIHGPPGCGKSHLAHVFAAASHALVVRAAALTADDPPRLVAGRTAVAVEDADQLQNELALLHLYNHAREHGVRLLLTARTAPALWMLSLPDLRSRLLTVPTVAIHPPDDTLMAAVLVKLFADRQIKVGQDVISYLLGHMERSFAAAREVVEAADRLALAHRRAVAVPLIAEVLRQRFPETGDESPP